MKHRCRDCRHCTESHESFYSEEGYFINIPVKVCEVGEKISKDGRCKRFLKLKIKKQI